MGASGGGGEGDGASSLLPLPEGGRDFTREALCFLSWRGRRSTGAPRFTHYGSVHVPWMRHAAMKSSARTPDVLPALYQLIRHGFSRPPQGHARVPIAVLGGGLDDMAESSASW